MEEPEARGGDNTEMGVPFSESAAEGLVVEEVSVARRHPEYFASLSPPASRVDHMGRMNSIL